MQLVLQKREEKEVWNKMVDIMEAQIRKLVSV